MSSATAYPFTGSGTIGPNPPTGFVKILGMTVRETVGTNPVTITLRENTVSGKILAEQNCPAGTSPPPFFAGDQGIRCSGQVYVQVGGTGVASGVIYVL